MINPEDFDPEPDDLDRDQLAEVDPMWRAVADTLDEWLHRMHGITAGLHNAGAFLEFLALHGYQVTAMEPVPSLEELLGPPDLPVPAQDGNNHQQEPK